jgi:enoyl-CoA hydratase
MHSYCAYMMASHRRVIYIGFTGRLQARVKEHKIDFYPESFTSRYRCHNLVYWESFDEPIPAINREKELKKMRRVEKIALIEKHNPKWKDLAAGWGRRLRASDLKELAPTGQRVGGVPTDPSSRKKSAPQDDSGREIYFEIQQDKLYTLLRVASVDGTNRFTLDRVHALTSQIEMLSESDESKPLIITGNSHFFSAGADLNEIAGLAAPDALEFAKTGQRLMHAVAKFPAPTFAAIEGYCMGGGLDLALACHRRICAPNTIFGHRGAALGLVTGWGGTQRLPRLVGKGRAMQMFLAAEKLNAQQALAAGLVEAVVADPVTYMTDTLLRGL